MVDNTAQLGNILPHGSTLPQDAVMPDTAVVLAGGLGTRLRVAVADCPKTLAPVSGRPFLAYLLSYLADQGVHRVILSLGYLAEQVMSFIEGAEKLWDSSSKTMMSREAPNGTEVPFRSEVPFRIIPVIEQLPLGTGGALRYASKDLREPFFALNGDTLFKVELKRLWQFHLQRIKAHSNTTATISLRRVTLKDDLALRGCVRVDPEGGIIAFAEKPDLGNDLSRVGDENMQSTGHNGMDLRKYPSVLTNGGIYIFQPDALADLPPADALIDRPEVVSLERTVFPELASAGRLAGCIQDGYFVDIGTPENLAAFENDVIKGVYAG